MIRILIVMLCVPFVANAENHINLGDLQIDFIVVRSHDYPTSTYNDFITVEVTPTPNNSVASSSPALECLANHLWFDGDGDKNILTTLLSAQAQERIVRIYANSENTVNGKCKINTVRL